MPFLGHDLGAEPSSRPGTTLAVIADSRDAFLALGKIDAAERPGSRRRNSVSLTYSRRSSADAAVRLARKRADESGRFGRATQLQERAAGSDPGCFRPGSRPSARRLVSAIVRGRTLSDFDGTPGNRIYVYVTDALLASK
jgi:hypothetical protein